ncbi:hypothetical protein F2Q69_00029948 [Brassica cretica]|uniref:Uncharacterized protein n=1 Tax=Brassica cretica TaxID=69181 RepID=A0A8S9RRR9_BRACR|nr:hypothetical protein F2Q69_00029948 [Brassica cretica]
MAPPMEARLSLQCRHYRMSTEISSQALLLGLHPLCNVPPHPMWLGLAFDRVSKGTASNLAHTSRPIKINFILKEPNLCSPSSDSLPALPTPNLTVSLSSSQRYTMTYQSRTVMMRLLIVLDLTSFVFPSKFFRTRFLGSTFICHGLQPSPPLSLYITESRTVMK